MVDRAAKNGFSSTVFQNPVLGRRATSFDLSSYDGGLGCFEHMKHVGFPHPQATDDSHQFMQKCMCLCVLL